MYQPVVLYISLRYMRKQVLGHFNYFISWLSTIAITFSVMAMVIVSSIMNGFEHALEKNTLGLLPQVLLTTHERRLDPKRVPASIVDSLTGVKNVTPIIISDVLLQSARNVAVGVMLGINPNDPEPLSRYLLEARQSDLGFGKYQVVLGHELAAALSVKRGDSIRIIVPIASQITPIGRIPSQRLFTVAGTFAANSEVDSYQLLVNQQDASRLMRYPDGYVTGWRLWLKKPLLVKSLSTQSLPDGLVWHDWRERHGELFQAVHMEKKMMCLLFSLIVIVAAFNIITSLGLLVIKKQAEIAILQTLGLTCCKIMLIFITRGASIGIISAFLGSSFGILLAIQLNHLTPIIRVMFDGITLPVAIELTQVAVIALSAVIIALLSTIFPSLHAATIRPAEVLRHE